MSRLVTLVVLAFAVLGWWYVAQLDFVRDSPARELVWVIAGIVFAGVAYQTARE